MQKELPIKFLVISAFGFSLMTGILFSSMWLVQTVLWTILSSVIYFFYFKDLNFKYKVIFLYIFASYLILESFLKMVIFYSGNGSIWFNTLEHFMWSFYFSALIYFPLFKALKGKKLLFCALILLSIVNLIGVLNELVEFVIRSINGLEDLPYYQDSIRDLFLNIVGSFAFSVIIIYKKIKKDV